jgi:hypothetical protein
MSAVSHREQTTMTDAYTSAPSSNVIEKYNFNDFDLMDKSLDNIFYQCEDLIENSLTPEEKQRTIIRYKYNYTTMNNILIDNEMHAVPVSSAQAGPDDAGPDDRKNAASELQKDFIKSFKVTNYAQIEYNSQVRIYKRMKSLEKILNIRMTRAEEYKQRQSYASYGWKILVSYVMPTFIAGGISAIGIGFQAMVILKSINDPIIWLSFGEKIFSNKFYFDLFNDIMSGLKIFNINESLLLRNQYNEVDAFLKSHECCKNSEENKLNFIKKTIMVVFGLKDDSGALYDKDKFNAEFQISPETPVFSFFDFIKKIIDKKNPEEKLKNSTDFVDFIMQNYDSPKFKFAFAAFGLVVPIFGYVRTTIELFNNYREINSNIIFQGIKAAQHLSSYKEFMAQYGGIVANITTTKCADFLNYVFKNDKTAEAVGKIFGLFGMNSDAFGMLITSAAQVQINSSITNYFDKIIREAEAKKKESEELEKIINKEKNLVAEIEEDVLKRAEYKWQNKTNEEIIELMAGDDSSESDLKLKFFVSRYLVIFKKQFVKLKKDPFVYFSSLLTTSFLSSFFTSYAYMYIYSTFITEGLPALVLKGTFKLQFLPLLRENYTFFRNLPKTPFETWSLSDFLEKYIEIYYGYTSDEQVNQEIKKLKDKWINEIISDFQVIHTYLQNEFLKTRVGISINRRIEKLNDFILFRICNTCCKLTYSMVLIPSMQFRLANKVPNINTHFFKIFFERGNEKLEVRFCAWFTNKLHNISVKNFSLEEIFGAFKDFVNIDKILYNNLIPFLTLEDYYDTQNLSFDVLFGKVLYFDSYKTGFDINRWVKEWDSKDNLKNLGIKIEDLAKEKVFGLKHVVDENGDKLQYIRAFEVMEQFEKMQVLPMPKIQPGSQLETELENFYNKLASSTSGSSINYKSRMEKMVKYEAFIESQFDIQFVKYSEYKISNNQGYQIKNDFDYYDFIKWLKTEKHALTSSEVSSKNYDPKTSNAIEIALLDEVMLYTQKHLLILGFDTGIESISSQNAEARKKLPFDSSNIAAYQFIKDKLINKSSSYYNFLKHDYSSKYIDETFENMAASNFAVDIIIPNFVGFNGDRIDVLEFMGFEEKIQYVMNNSDVDSLMGMFNQVKDAENTLTGASAELNALEYSYNAVLKPIYKKVHQVYKDFVKLYSGIDNKDVVKLSGFGFDYGIFKTKLLEYIKENTTTTQASLLGDISTEKKTLKREIDKIVKKCTINVNGTDVVHYVSVGEDIDINTFEVKPGCSQSNEILNDDDLMEILFHPEVIVYIIDLKNKGLVTFTHKDFNEVFSFIEKNMFEVIIRTFDEQVKEFKLKLETKKTELSAVSDEDEDKKTQIEYEISKLMFQMNEMEEFEGVFNEMTLRAKTSVNANKDLYAYLSYNFKNSKITKNNINSTVEGTNDIEATVNNLGAQCNDDDKNTVTKIFDFLEGTITPNPQNKEIQLSNARDVSSTTGRVQYSDITKLSGKSKFFDELFDKLKTLSIKTSETFESIKTIYDRGAKSLTPAAADKLSCEKIKEYLIEYKEWLKLQREVYVYYRRVVSYSINLQINSNVGDYRTNIVKFYDDFNRDIHRLKNKFDSEIERRRKGGMIPVLSPVLGSSPVPPLPEPLGDNERNGRPPATGGPALEPPTPDIRDAQREVAKQQKKEETKLKNEESQSQETELGNEETTGEEESNKEENKEELQMSLLFGGNDFFDFLNRLANSATGSEKIPPETKDIPSVGDDETEYDKNEEKGGKMYCEDNAKMWGHYAYDKSLPYQVYDPNVFTKQQAKSCSDDNVMVKSYEAFGNISRTLTGLVTAVFAGIATFCGVMAGVASWLVRRFCPPNIDPVSIAACGSATASLAYWTAMATIAGLISRYANCAPHIILSLLGVIVDRCLTDNTFNVDVNDNFIKMFFVSQFIYYYGSMVELPEGRDVMKNCNMMLQAEFVALGPIGSVLSIFMDISKLDKLKDKVMNNLNPTVKRNGVTVPKYIGTPADYNPYGKLNLGLIDPVLKKYDVIGDIKPNDNYFITVGLLIDKITESVPGYVKLEVEAFIQLERTNPTVNVADYKNISTMAAILIQFEKGTNATFMLNYMSSRIFDVLWPTNAWPNGNSPFPKTWLGMRLAQLFNPITGKQNRTNLVKLVTEVILQICKNEILRVYFFTALFGNKTPEDNHGNGIENINIFRDIIEDLFINLLNKHTDQVTGQIKDADMSKEISDQIDNAIYQIFNVIIHIFTSPAPPPPPPPNNQEKFIEDRKKERREGIINGPEHAKNIYSDAMKDGVFDDLETCPPP